MSESTHLANPYPAEPPRASASRRFPATTGRFEDLATRRDIDALARWVEERYQEELAQRPSKHVYVRRLPRDVIAQIDALRDSDLIRDAILQHFDAGWAITSMKNTDELYLSHYNKDLGGDHGLFSRHYDGNLRFVPFGAVVRALIYLQSDGTYKVVFEDSRLEKAFETYEFGLLDFHRELHRVEGEYRPGGRQRILLKCNYFVGPKGAALATGALLAANTGVFYVVKAAMEYSKSPKTVPQRAVGLLCNFFRVLNNVHPAVPLAFIAVVLGAAGWGMSRLLV